MPNCLPPPDYVDDPVLVPLAAGTILYRVHRKNFPADSFNPVPSHRYYGGGRFDATADDAYSYLYAGETIDVAIAETLLRDFVFDSTGHYVLPRTIYAGRRISAVRTVVDLELVGMRTRPQLSSFAQSPWITNCPPMEYAQTRHWGHWIRAKAPKAAGYVWNSRQEPSLGAFVLFGDRHGGKMVEPVIDPLAPSDPAADFDTDEGREALAKILEPFRVTV